METSFAGKLWIQATLSRYVDQADLAAEIGATAAKPAGAGGVGRRWRPDNRPGQRRPDARRQVHEVLQHADRPPAIRSDNGRKTASEDYEDRNSRSSSKQRISEHSSGPSPDDRRNRKPVTGSSAACAPAGLRPAIGTPGCARRAIHTGGSVIGRSLTPRGFPSTTEIGFSGPFRATSPKRC